MVSTNLIAEIQRIHVAVTDSWRGDVKIIRIIIAISFGLISIRIALYLASKLFGHQSLGVTDAGIFVIGCMSVVTCLTAIRRLQNKRDRP